MNIHHLELFYYVAKHGGISEAVRNMPYGIQQPAVSGQIIQLEEFLGTPLFRRRPFKLTTSGEEVYAFIRPFFDNLDAMTSKLQGGTAHHIRIGASEIVLRDHLPPIARTVAKQFPSLKLTLREGYQPQIETWLEQQEIDLGFTLLGEKRPAAFNTMPLLRIPLMLIVSRKSRLKSADELWMMDRIDESLITLPSYEPMCRSFQEGLGRKGIDWFPSIEVSSLKLIETYVAEGHGIGLFLDIPKTRFSPRVRSIPLPDFDPVTFGAVWLGKPTPVIQAFIEATRVLAVELLGSKCMATP